MCVYFDQLTLAKGKSVACQPAYHAEAIWESPRMDEFRSLLELTGLSRASTQSASRGKDRESKANMMVRKERRSRLSYVARALLLPGSSDRRKRRWGEDL